MTKDKTSKDGSGYTGTLYQHEDLTIQKLENGTIRIVKLAGGISDSSMVQRAVGKQKLWQLLDAGGNDTMEGVEARNGNRPLEWSGVVPAGAYTLCTGPAVKDWSPRRIPGRGYSVQFYVP
jgi:hypothetical protein